MPKRIVPLTPLQISNAKARENEYKIFDGGGLYLLITPSGGKLWRLKYRFHGKEQLLSLGSFSQITLAEARKEREKAKALIVQGINPREERKEQQAEKNKEKVTFEVIAREWHERYITQWTSRTADAVLAMLARDVFGEIGSQPIAAINAPMLLIMLRRIEARGAVYTAHRVRGLCGQVFRYGVAIGQCERDPTGDLKGAIAPIKTTHRAATTDPKDLGPLLRMLDGYNKSLMVQSALRLLPMLFVRPGELRTMQWCDVDLDKGEWAYLITKTDTLHIVPLARQAVEILKEIYKVTGDGHYVFQNGRSRERPMSDMAMNAAMRRMGIDTKSEQTSHGFRAVARTILDEVLGFRPEIIEHQLAHAVRDPLGRAYNRTAHLAERRQMMQAWADYLDALKQTDKNNLISESR